MIIDFHTHIFPDKIAQRAIEALEENAKSQNLKALHNGTKDALKSLMSVAGIDYSVVLPIATKPSQTKTINEFAQIINNDDRLFSFGSVHPKNTDYKEHLDNIKKSGLKGIKLHPDYQGFFFDDNEVFPILEYAASLNLPIIVHSGVDYAFSGEQHCTPKMLLEVSKRLPEAIIIAAHLGGFDYWDDVEKYLVGSNVYIDTSLSTQYCTIEQFKRIILNYDENRILFATDSPWADQKHQLDKIRNMEFPSVLLDKIFYRNAMKVLKLNVLHQ